MPSSNSGIVYFSEIRVHRHKKDTNLKFYNFSDSRFLICRQTVSLALGRMVGFVLKFHFSTPLFAVFLIGKRMPKKYQLVQ